VLVLLGLLLTASCATVTNLGSYELKDNPNLYSTLRIVGYFTVTHFDDKDVSCPGASRAVQSCFWGRPNDKYAEVRIHPGRHNLQFDLHNCGESALKPLHVAHTLGVNRFVVAHEEGV
jgi:hypothetical protein